MLSLREKRNLEKRAQHAKPEQHSSNWAAGLVESHWDRKHFSFILDDFSSLALFFLGLSLIYLSMLYGEFVN